MGYTRCANENCVKHSEDRGGRYRLMAGKWYCEDCSPNIAVMNSAKNLWDFTTTHFTGEKVHVRSGRHLDELCRKHGVSNHARENMERSWNTPPPAPPPPQMSMGGLPPWRE